MHVRLKVAERQASERGLHSDEKKLVPRLKALLRLLFGDAACDLDHDPPLMLRGKRLRGHRTFYIPDANDPAHLVYRLTEDHRIKTFVRGDGAQRSDMAQRRYLRRLDQNRGLKAKKPFRKIQGRNNLQSRKWRTDNERRPK